MAWETVVLRGRIGRTTAVCSAVCLIAAVCAFILLRGISGAIAGIALVLVSALIILYPLTTKYIFGPEAIEVRDLSFREVPARYDSVYKVEESEGIVAGSHCTASGCIVIRYDRESNRMIAVTPSDRDAAMDLLRTRCPSAEFTTRSRS